MTDEERADEYASSYGDDNIIDFGDDQLNLFPLRRWSFLAGLEAGKDMNVPAKWHDLRKDPNDLPVRRCIDNDGNVVRLFHNSWDKKLTWYRYDFHECEWWQMETEPIAWCEIPEYTEE